MRLQSLTSISRPMLGTLALASLLVLPACSINVKKDKSGQDKRVDIETPVGGIHVDTQADVRDTGLPVYPGARPKQKDNTGNEKSANVNISSGVFALKVIAVEYESDDTPEKLISYYRDQLKRYGSVLECRTSDQGYTHSSSGEKEHQTLKCDGDNSGKNVELKVGTEDNQHIVAIRPQDKGSSFALVYVKTRGKDTI